MRALVSEEGEAGDTGRTSAPVEPDGEADTCAPATVAVFSRLPGWAPSALVAMAVVTGIALRLYSRSPLWLDEALSVNISRLPVGDLFDALRHDGHPPLYYLILHYWMEAFGEGDVAVRLLSSVFGIATLPLAWIAGRRLGGTAGARWALVLVALSPYCIRYATETRMYSLVMLLVFAGYLVVTDALRSPTWLRLGAIALLSGLLLLSHYWAFWLLAAVFTVLAWRWWRRPEERAPTLRVALAVAAGGVLFLPWLPGFVYQATHTGTPWAGPVRPTMLLEVTIQDLGGGEVAEGKLGGAVLLILCLLALFTVRSVGRTVVLDVRTAPTVRTELIVVGLTMAIGCVTGYLSSSTYQARYAAVFVPLVLLAAAIGLTRIPGFAQVVAGSIAVVLAVGGVAWVEYYQRTQSEPIAAAVAERATPGDVVVYCPDQLGPAYSREMPDNLVELAYPTLAAPDLVDWVDYAERNTATDPIAIAAEIRAEHRDQGVFVVWRPQYDTFGEQCEQLVSTLGEGRSSTPLVSADEGRYYEPANMTWIPAA